MRVFLIGLMGSGKTTVGRALSRRTGWPYLDNDALVRDATGRSGPDLEADGGVDALHAAEARGLERALAHDPPVIVGVAGWIVTDPELRALAPLRESAIARTEVTVGIDGEPYLDGSS